MRLLQLFEVMKHDKHVLWDNGTYFIAGNDPNDPTFLTLWTEDNERIGQLGTRMMMRNKEEWLGVAEVSVKKPYQGERLAIQMYRALLKNMPQRYAGLIGYQPDIVNKRVHSIYKRLGAHVEDGDYYIVPNPNRQTAITDDITDEMRHEFSCGSCAFLALLLHQEFGWPMAGYFDRDYEAEETQQMMGNNEPVYDDIHHVWVEIPGIGKAIDINGLADSDELQQDWADRAGAHEGRGNYVYEIDPGWVEGFINQWNPTPQVRENIFDMARSAVQELKVELKQEGLIESKLNEDEEEHIVAHMKEFAKQHGILIELSTEAGMIPGITVTDLYADNPGSGGGTKVLNELIKLADQHEVMLFIWPEGERNKLFYERFGFAMTQMPPQMIRVPNFDPEEFEELRRSENLMEVEIGRTLYHGTTKERAKEIMQNGLEPKVGELVKMAYEEYEDVVGELEPLGFVAEKEQFGAVMSAMKHHVEEMLFFATGKQKTASAEDILKYGAVLVFRDGEGEFIHRSEDHDPTDYEEHPTQVEPGDWYTWDIVKPSYALTGQPMIRLLKRMGQWPLIGAYAPDTDVNKRALKADLVRRLIAKEPDRDKNEILAQVNALSAKELGQAQWNAQWVSEAQQLEERHDMVVKNVFHATSPKEKFSKLSTRGKTLFFSKQPRTADFGKQVHSGDIWFDEPFMFSPDDIFTVMGTMSDEAVMKTIQDSYGASSWQEVIDDDALQGADLDEFFAEQMASDLGYWQHPLIVDAMKQAGYDGVVSNDPFGGSVEFVIFNDEQFVPKQQYTVEARKPREPRWDYWQFMDHYGIEEKARNLHDYVLPWVNENRPGNINKMVRDPEYRLISQLALYFKLLRAGKPITRGGTKSTLSKFEAALDTPIQVWRGGGGDYDPNRRHPRPWLSFTMDKRRVKTFSQYAGTYASPAFMLPERTRYWEIELTIPLRDVLGYIGVGGDAEVLVSKNDAKNARLITGKQRVDGPVTESVEEVYDTMEVIAQMQKWDEFFQEMRDAWVGGIADFGQPQAAINIQGHPDYNKYRAALSDAVTKYLGDPFVGYRLIAEDQIEEWQSGADMPAMAVSIDKRVALAFRKFASNQGRDDLKLVQLSVPADSVIMLGHEGEQELVVDPNWISANEVQLVQESRLFTKREQSRKVNKMVENLIKNYAIVEAPVRDFEVDPSVKQYYHGTWNRRDQAMLGNPKMADIVTKRIKTAIPIDMHFAGVIQMDRSEKWMSSHSQTAGRMTDKFREVLQDESGVSTAKAVKQKWGVDIVPAKDAITVLYMSNTNDVSSAIPITPWIMTHRLGHSLDDAAQANQLGSAASGARSLMEEIVVGNDEYTDLAQPISSFMTMKSARTTSLDEGEEIPELLAQYIYEGRIRLARYVHQSGRNHFKLSNGLTGDTLISNHPDSEDGNEMNKRIENVEQQLNEMAETIVTAAIGLLVVAP